MSTAAPTRRYARDSSHEDVIDIPRTSAALDRARDRITAEVEAVAQVVVPRMVRNRAAELYISEGMLTALEALYVFGQREARRELRDLGYDVPDRALADTDPARLTDQPAALLAALAALAAGLKRHTRRLRRAITQRVTDQPGEPITPREQRDIARYTAGARDAGLSGVSTAYTSGLSSVHETVPDVAQWAYSAALDGGTCPPCASADGQLFDTFEEAEAVLPGGGPNPSCRGGDRCRCRIVPVRRR